MTKLENILTLDVETGGLDDHQNGLCTVALSKKGTDVEFEFKIKPVPELTYTPKAMQINGLNLEELRKEGLSLEDSYKRVKNFIMEHFDGKPMILGQNVKFDIDFINERLFKVHRDDIYRYIKRGAYDTKHNADLFKHLGLYPKELHTNLGFLYEHHFNKQPENAHNALYDVQMTEQIFDEQVKMLKKGE